MTPVIIGLVLAIPLAWLTSSSRIGVAARRLGLFLIPEETAPPPVLVRSRELYRALAANDEIPDAVALLAEDGSLLEAHRAMLPPRRTRRSGGIDADLAIGLAKLDDLEDGEQNALRDLTTKEKIALLSDSRGLDRLMAIYAAARARPAE
jgi:membrane glycosyltransferase